MKKFLNIGYNFFNKVINPETEFDIAAKNFLDNGSLDLYLKMLKNGYSPTKEIDNAYTTIINKIIEDDDMLLHSIYDTGDFKFSNKQAVQYIKLLSNANAKSNSSDIFTIHHYKSFLKEFNYGYKLNSYLKEKNKTYDQVYNELKINSFLTFVKKEQENIEIKNSVFKSLQEIIFKEDFQQELVAEFVNEVYKLSTNKWKNKGKLYEHEVEGECIKLLNLWCVIDIKSFKNIDMNSYLYTKNILSNFYGKMEKLVRTSSYGGNDDISPDFLSSIRYIGKHMNDNVKVIYETDVDNLLNSINIKYLTEQSTKKAMDKFAVNAVNQFKTSSLPKDSMQHIDDIKEIYVSILKNNASGDVLIETNKMINDKLPNVINSFLSMEPEYRLTMKNNQGKNSQDLLLDSLISIKEVLRNNLEVLQEGNLRELSVQSRLLKMKSV